MRSAVVLWISTLVLVACGGRAKTGLAGMVSDASPPTDGSGAADTSSRVPAMHRATAACLPILVDPDAPCFSIDGGTEGGCTKNSNCTNGLNPRCEVFLPRGFCICQYDTCRSDSDCHAFGGVDAGACACNSNSLTDNCVGGNCRVDADCGPDGYCSPVFDACSGAINNYFCHTPKDKCIDDADCPGTSCSFVPTDSLWACVRLPHCQ
jgi:hypothetical protein